MFKNISTLTGSEIAKINGGICRCHCSKLGYIGTASSLLDCRGFCSFNGDDAVECPPDNPVPISFPILSNGIR